MRLAGEARRGETRPAAVGGDVGGVRGAKLESMRASRGACAASSVMRGAGFLEAHNQADCHLCEEAREPRGPQCFSRKRRSRKLWTSLFLSFFVTTLLYEKIDLFQKTPVASTFCQPPSLPRDGKKCDVADCAFDAEKLDAGKKNAGEFG